MKMFSILSGKQSPNQHCFLSTPSPVEELEKSAWDSYFGIYTLGSIYFGSLALQSGSVEYGLIQI